MKQKEYHRMLIIYNDLLFNCIDSSKELRDALSDSATILVLEAYLKETTANN